LPAKKLRSAAVFLIVRVVVETSAGKPAPTSLILGSGAGVEGFLEGKKSPRAEAG